MMGTPPLSPAWIAVDHTPGCLNIWAMDAHSVSIDTATVPVPTAIASLSTLAQILPDTTAQWTLPAPCPAFISGAIDSPKCAVPISAHPIPQSRGTANGLDIWAIPNTVQAAPADMLQGAEIQISGFLALNPEWDGIICCPGAHTRWVHISAGEIISFRTFLTGALHKALSEQTVLSNCVKNDDAPLDAFETDLQNALSRPERLASGLFSLFAAAQMNGHPSGTENAQLYALLIGAELAASKPFWLGQRIAVLTGSPLAELYMQALTVQSAFPEACDQTAAKLAGFTAAFNASRP